MRGTHGALRRPLIFTALLLTIVSATVSAASATSVTTTTQPSAQSVCGIVANPKVHVVSKSPCTIRVPVGTNVRIRFRSGFRWGYPVSTSKTVVVTSISRSSIGVNAATLHAASIGRATIRTTGIVACKPGVACPDLALLSILKVIVN